jgi:hypothetical protein
MATEDQIATLRGLINEPDDSNGWDDEKLGAAIDAAETLNAAASGIWYQKAGQLASLVDVSESGSTRKLGDLRKNAMEMGLHYASADGISANTGSGPVIQRIRRGFS